MGFREIWWRCIPWVTQQQNRNCRVCEDVLRDAAGKELVCVVGSVRSHDNQVTAVLFRHPNDLWTWRRRQRSKRLTIHVAGLSNARYRVDMSASSFTSAYQLRLRIGHFCGFVPH